MVSRDLAGPVRRALITGVTGQDGGYLAEHLIGLGYQVVGLAHEGDAALGELRARLPDVDVVTGDLRDRDSLVEALEQARPDEVYNLAAFSHPGRSWEQPELCADITGNGVLRLLEAIRSVSAGDPNRIRLCHASSSEIFAASAAPLDESSALGPRSPYGSAKAFAHHVVGNYRDGHGLFACAAILFNHESPRRPPSFVTRKITQAAAAISLGQQGHVTLGNLDVRRDWGHAADYVAAMHLMLQQPGPSDFVVATGRSHSLADLLRIAFAHVGLDDWQSHVRQDPDLLRPVDTPTAVGNATKAAEVLGWKPRRTFETMVREMVDHDLQALSHQPA